MNRPIILRSAILITVLLTAGAALAGAMASTAQTRADECVAADRMPLLGCVVGEAARQRADGRWRIDPGMVVWNGSPVVVVDSGRHAKLP
jgi:hypothetical protein